MKDDHYDGNQAIAADQHNKERDYWLNKLAGEIVKSVFPYDNKKVMGMEPIESSYEPETVKLTFSNELFSRLTKLSNRFDPSLHMIFTAAVVLLLAKYTRSSDIIVGAPVLKQEIEARFINTVLILRNTVEDPGTFKELLLQIRQTIVEATENQNYPIETLLYQLNLSDTGEDFPLFDVAVLLENIHDKQYLRHINYNVLFSFRRQEECIDAVLEYNPRRYHSATMERIAGHLTQLLQEAVFNIERPVKDIDILSEPEKQRILFQFNNTRKEIVKNKCYHQLFEEQVAGTPHKTAAIYNRSKGTVFPPTRDREHISYKELNEKANQLAVLLKEKGIGPDCPVGILCERSIAMLTGILGVFKAGGAYVPIEVIYPRDRIKNILTDSGASVLLATAASVRGADFLFWECETLNSLVILDHYQAKGSKKEAHLRKVWDFVAEDSTEAVNDYRWSDSCTGEPFSLPEMQQYIDNFKEKLAPHLNPQTRVLEVGCGHGLVLFEIAPKVGYYLATDLTPVIIEKNKQRVQREGIQNVELKAAAASEIDTLEQENFDIFICSSVIHFFPDTLFLERFIKNAMDLLDEKGIIYLDDILDLRKKRDLVQSRLQYKKLHPEAPVKMDWDDDLFVDIDFFHYLQSKYPQIVHWQYSEKLGNIKNELTRFRYDVIIEIDKKKAGGSRSVPEPRKAIYTGKDMKQYPVENLKSVNDPSHLSYIIYTSGTTGKPKGVSIHHQGMLNHLYAKISDLSIHAGDIIAQTASAGFDISVWQFLAGLLVGGTTFIIEREAVLEPKTFLEILREGRVTVLESVPSLMTAFLEEVSQEQDKALTDLRWMVPTGEALTVSLVREWYKHYPGIRLVNAYGPTEASDDVTHFVVEEVPPPHQFSIPIGKPLQNTHIYILDKNLSLCPIGIRGEICVAGLGVGRGYWKDQDKTDTVFVPNPYLEDIRDNDYAVVYKTGDIGYYREDGNIECLGRIDHQVKIRGNRIELGEIESRLIAHEAVDEAVVLAVDDEKGNKNLCAYMVSGKELTGSELREYLSRELPDYMIPLCFIPVDKIPLTPNGKVDREALPPPRFDATAGELTAPRDKTEKKLVEIWAQVLQLKKDQLGIDLNFFEMGGHSLRATILAAKIHKELNVKLPLTEIFSGPTIRELAERIKAASEDLYTPIVPVEKKEYYVLSSVQRRLYLLQQLDPHSTSYNTQPVIPLQGDVNREKLEEIFRKLIKRHESLRTTFQLIHHQLHQRVHDNRPFAIEYFDFTGGGPGVKVKVETGEDREDVIIKNFIKPFDLSRAPLMRVGLITRGEKEHILMVDMHHIISDGTSNDLLRKDFVTLYEGKELSHMPLQYKDYAVWQNYKTQQKNIKKQEAYWLKEFEGDIPVLSLPTDYVRPEAQDFEGDMVNFEAGKEETKALNEFARNHDVTLFMLLLAAYYVLLSKLSGQEDIIVGTPTAGRNHTDLNPIIGMFINTLALRNKPRHEETFIQFLNELKIKTLKAFENQDYPLDDLVEKVVQERDPSRNPLFDAAFILQNFEVSNLEVSSLGLRSIKYHYMTTKFDLHLHGEERGDNLYFLLQYSCKLFTRETIEKFVYYYKKILAAVLENEDIELYQLMKISDDKRKELLARFAQNPEMEYE